MKKCNFKKSAKKLAWLTVIGCAMAVAYFCGKDKGYREGRRDSENEEGYIPEPEFDDGCMNADCTECGCDCQNDALDSEIDVPLEENESKDDVPSEEAEPIPEAKTGEGMTWHDKADTVRKSTKRGKHADKE